MKSYYILGLIAIATLAGCSSSEVVPDMPPADLYTQSQINLKAGNWGTATSQLEALDSRYPFGPYSDQVQLNLIYAYYKSGDFALASAHIERFRRLNPTHERADWVLYMRGLNNIAQDDNFMQSIFNIDRSDRDPLPARAAFSDFKNLLITYPNSLYAADAKQRLLAIKNRLANYDLSTADYYMRRSAWIAAINRCQEIQKTYPNTKAARQSLQIQLKAYKALNLEGGIKRTEELIEKNNA